MQREGLAENYKGDFDLNNLNQVMPVRRPATSQTQAVHLQGISSVDD